MMRTKIASAKALILFITLISVVLLVPGMVKGGTSVATVEKTGQTKCYNNTVEITCPQPGQDFYGQDGELQKGVAWPNPRFTDNGNGTVTDNLTGLVWLKDANPCGLKNWADALAYCNSLASGTAGLTDGSVTGDWRLPNLKELQSLIDFNNYNPALPAGYPFTDVQSNFYWSGMSNISNTGKAWIIYPVNGVTYLTENKLSRTYPVWPVRGGQCGTDTSVICLPKTGQTTCWDADGNQISCAGTGQDGELQKGVAWPDPRFTDKGNGTVKDNLTGLVWLKDANPCGLKNWADALAYSNSLASGTAGLTDGSIAGDWRLPNVKELESLIDFGSYNPPLPSGHPFTGVQISDYWLSTTTVWLDKTYLAHRIQMQNGGMTVHDIKATSSHYVWPVRDEEKCSVSVTSTVLPLNAGLLPHVRRIVITGENSNWDRTTAVSIEDIPIVIPMRVQPAKIIALIVIPSTLTGFTQGEKEVGVATGADLCAGTVDIQ